MPVKGGLFVRLFLITWFILGPTDNAPAMTELN